jgi:hypothetical protein
MRCRRSAYGHRSARLSSGLQVGFLVMAVLMISGGLALMIPAGPKQTNVIHLAWNGAVNWGKEKLQPEPGHPSEPVIYPYSIVPGGIHSLAELRRAMEIDPVVAAQYAKFNLSKFRIVKVRHDEYVYVSYRIGSDVFWTKKRLRICKGETLVTDGEYFARTRCGNQLSQVPQVSTWSSEPPAAVLDTPVAPLPGADTDAFAAVGPNFGLPAPDAVPSAPANLIPSFAGGGNTPFVATPLVAAPVIVPYGSDVVPYGAALPLSTCGGANGCSIQVRPKSPTPLSPVPEESTWIMLVTGLGGLVFYKLLLSRYSSRTASNS